MQWYACVRCREEGVTKARQRAMADRLPAGPLAAAIQSAKAVCGWMTQPCRHAAHCLPAQPPQLVLEMWQDSQGIKSTPPPQDRAPDDIRAMCERMEAITLEPEHVAAAKRFEQEQAEREERQRADAVRRQELEKQERIDKGRESQKRWWRRQYSEGLRPVPKHPGPLLTRSQYLDQFAGHETPSAYEQVQTLGFYAVLAGMEAYQRHNKTYDQREKDFFMIARRIQRGFGVDWMTPDQIERDEHTELSWDDKRGPYLAQDGIAESDLPLDWYDGGDSKAWKEQQKEDAWRHCERKGQDRAKTNLSDLLKGIGK